MHKITIIRTGGTPHLGFAAELSIDGGDPYEVAIANPFQKKQESELELYFEQWQRFPVTDTTIARRAARSVQEYGMHLFSQIFANKGARDEYNRMQDQKNEVLIEIVSDLPDFHALHWEALWDPCQARPLAVDCVMVRKSLEQAPKPFPTTAYPELNLLLLVARPEGEWDVGYRTISRPVVEAVQAGKLRVNVELLRPGTFEALSKQLKARGPGYYHIVHFDCHGALLDYDQARQVLDYRNEKRYGWRRLGRYQGVKPFLFFEGARAGSVDLVKGLEVAKVLVAANVSICILNACQSGKQVLQDTATQEGHTAHPTPTRDTSLGSCLLSEGLQVVVAMAYRVTISASQVLATELYSQLCTQRPVLESLRQGRLEMYNNKKRRGGCGVTVELEDWMLPVVYTNQPVDFRLCNLDVCIVEGTYSPGLHSCHSFRVPKYGFVGRDLDILKVETGLLHHNTLLLRGMSGTGKTTLLKYLCEWWQITHFAANVFYFGFEEQAWTLRQILVGILQQSCNEDGQRELPAMSDAALAEEVVEILKGTDSILMLDNLETVTSSGMATMNALPLDEQARVHSLLDRLVKEQTKLVLGSQGRGGWLADMCGDNVHHLHGLDLESQSVLAQKILERCVGDEIAIAELNRSDDFHQLLKILGGYPLAMEVVLANLEQQTPSQILTALDKGDVQLDAPSHNRESSILHSMECSFDALCSETRQLLVCLAPFKSALVWTTVQLYIRELQLLGYFGMFNFTRFDEALGDAIEQGLLLPCGPSEIEDEEASVLSMQPVLPYFLKTRLCGLEAGERKAMRIAFKAACRNAAKKCMGLLISKVARERGIGLQLCKLEYENLHNAFVLCMEDVESTEIGICLTEYCGMRCDYRSALKLALLAIETQSAYPSAHKTAQTKQEIAHMQYFAGNMYYELNDYKRAKEAYVGALEIAQSGEGNVKRAMSWHGHLYHNLGVLAQDSRDYEEALEHYQRAGNIYIEFNDRHSQASIYHHMGNIALGLRDFAEARRNYRQALDIETSFNNQLSQAKTYHNLGVVAQELRNFVEARQNYQRALDIYTEFGDQDAQANTYIQMGRVAHELRKFEEARQSYQRALDINIECNDKYSQAHAFHRLGILAKDLRDFVEARHNYQRALNIYIEFDDQRAQASTYHSLGMVAQELRDFTEARRNYEHALDIKIDLKDQHSQAGTYNEMGRVVQELREFDEARRNYQQAMNIYIIHDDRYSQAGTYHHMGMLAEELRDFAEARLNYQQALDIYIKFNDRHAQASTYHQLGNVAKELREFVEAHQNYQQALEIELDFDDKHSLASTYHQMGGVALEMWDFVEARQNYQKALDIKVELQDRYSQAHTYNQMAKVAQLQRDFVEALQNYQKALDIYIEFKDRNSQANTYHNLGSVAQESRNFSEAGENYRRALDIYVEFNDQHSQASTYYQLGGLALELGNLVEARQNFQRALAIRIELNDRYSQANTYHALGIVAHELKDFTEARQNYQEALNIKIEFNAEHSQAHTYIQMGTLAKVMRDFVEARESYQKALDIYTKFDDCHGLARSYGALGMLYYKEEMLDLAKENLWKGAELFVEANDQRRAIVLRQFAKRISASGVHDSWVLRMMVFFWRFA